MITMITIITIILYLTISSSSLMISKLHNNYDACIIDQWGVLHNGKIPYNGAIECLQMLKENKKRLIMLSNSSKRRSSSFKGLSKVGIDPNLFDDIITSGEIGHQLLLNRQLDNLNINSNSNYKLKVFVIGNNDDDIEYVNSANCIITSPDDADIVLARGTFSILCNDNDSIIKYDNAETLMNNITPWLEKCAEKKLPMLVTNPDFHRPGSNSPMPGQIGELYSKYGLPIEYIGKPYPLVYQECMKVLSKNNINDYSRIVGIGDSLEHDILGAHKFGIKSIWTCNGVHAASLGTEEGASIEPSDENIDRLYKSLESHLGACRPTHIVPAFNW